MSEGTERWPWIDRCVGACVITDAERYTSVAERIDAAATVDFINRYLEVLFKPVFENGGLISDVKGDGMLAIWTEPSPTAELRARVCRACAQIAEDSARFFGAEGGHRLATRIGAFYGPLALATVGTPAHHEYRAVGDTVNTASRLEELNKALGTRVLVSASLAQGLEGFLLRDLGEIELRGKRNNVKVVELVARQECATESERRLCSAFDEAMLAQRRGQYYEALARLRELHARFPDDGPVRFFLRRCQRLAQQGPGATATAFALATTEAARLEAA